jgi:3-isopropylmalate dehydrogenase
MRLQIAVLPGDGIGPEVIAEALKVFRVVGEFAGIEFRLAEYPFGGAACKQTGVPLPQATLNACLESDAVLLGAVGAPEFDQLPREQRPESGLLALRFKLGGYANLRPAAAYEAILDCSPLQASVVSGADLLVVRELLGGIYFGEPRAIASDGASAFNTMRYSVDEIERIARIAFQEATRRRQKVTSVDKANVLETSQLWRQVVTRVGREFPNVALDHMYVDSCAMQLVTDPRRFDVILTENLFGDILSDEAAVLAGSLGMLASASIGGSVSLYEPVHGSAPDIAGRGIANPLGAISSAAMLLRYTAGLQQEASDIESAIRKVLDDGYRTADLARGGRTKIVSTAEMGSAVENELAGILDQRCSYHAV